MKKNILPPKKIWKAYLQNVKTNKRWIVRVKARTKFQAMVKLSSMYGFNPCITLCYITEEDNILKEL